MRTLRRVGRISAIAIAARYATSAGELIIEGGRVDASIGSRIVVPWSERIRYGSRKNGYHGGISPQEVVVPMCVMARAGL